jgi:hypothetical protein
LIDLALACNQSVIEALEWDDKTIATVADWYDRKRDAAKDANRK